MTNNETTPAQRIQAWLAATAHWAPSGANILNIAVDDRDEEVVLRRSDLEAVLESLEYVQGKLIKQAQRIRDLGEDVDKLRALEAHGVDNWEGYGTAMQSLEDGE